MERRRPDRRPTGGGTRIPSLRPPRARLIAGALAFGVAIGIAALSLDVRSGGLIFLSGFPGAIIVGILGLALLVGRPGWIGPILGLFALLYLGRVLLAQSPDLITAAAVGLGLLLVGELAEWSFDSRLRGRYDRGLHRSRLLGILALVLLGGVAAVLMLLLAGLPLSGGLITIVAGVTGFVALALLVSAVALRTGERAPDPGPT